MKRFILFCIATLIVITACDFISERFPHPDLEIINLHPLGHYVTAGENLVTIDTVAIVPRNSVDAIINSFFWEFYLSDSTPLGSRSEPFRTHFYVRGRIDTTSTDTFYVLNLSIPVKDAVEYITDPANDVDACWVKLYMTAEDAYENQREDTTWARFGIYHLAGGAILTIEAIPESIAVTDTSVVTATLTTIGGTPIVGEDITFTTDFCHLSSYTEQTNVNGQAFTTFFGDSTCVATVTASHAEATPASVLITVE